MAGFTTVCGCGHRETSLIKDQAKAAIVWHVFEAHPELWELLFGVNLPDCPDPRVRPRR